jgi:hypothetical protein
MYMTKLVDRPLIRGAARLLDIGGVLAWRGTRDPAEASARLMDEAWAMFGVALKGCASFLWAHVRGYGRIGQRGSR